VSGEHGDDRLRVEAWEMELARRIAGSFRLGDEDLKAELFKRLAEIKAKKLSAVHNWRAFLAQSLYNATKNFFRHENALRGQAKLLFIDDESGEDERSYAERKLIAPEDPVESRLHLGEVWAALTPEMRELAQVLFEEEGNVSSVAKRLGRPRKTVEYWIRKLRTVLKKHGLE
jgi:DNA-directed RNA polymerase specialized sigma24 family protein